MTSGDDFSDTTRSATTMPKCPAAGKRSCEARFRGGIEVPSWQVTAGRDLAKFGGPLQASYGRDILLASGGVDVVLP